MPRVFVGMSGGVDSSLTAALLKEQGYDVVGVYMKNWTKDLPGMECPWAEDLADAKRVSVQLHIPLKVFDFEKEYKHKVVDYMIAEYALGRTPNPDIMCNKEVKFKLFLDTALAAGADKIATGHYATVENGTLLAGADTSKDQSYFLYRVTSEALRRTLMPLGRFKKSEVRDMAKKRGLATAFRKDSQGICFIGKVGIKEFLSEYVQPEPGEIIDTATNKIIGHHEGALFYTIGQRHGLDVGGGLPYYVIKKDMHKNQVFVTTDLNAVGLWRDTATLHDLHWITEPPKNNQQGLAVRLRYHAPLIPCTITGNEETLELHLSEPERAITAGQSAVLYQGNVVLGGGIVG